MKEVVFFRELLSDLGSTPIGPTVIRSDNRGVIDLSFDPVTFKKAKRIFFKLLNSSLISAHAGLSLSNGSLISGPNK